MSTKNSEAHEKRMEVGTGKNTVLDHLARIMRLTVELNKLGKDWLNENPK
jgi:hypothetical protein